MLTMWTPMLLNNTVITATQTSDFQAWVESQLPTWFLQDFAGIEHWRWVALVLVVAIGFIIDLVVRFFFKKGDSLIFTW